MLDQQVIDYLVNKRDLFEARERQNKSYSWFVFVAAHVLVEIFWQTIASIFFFICWYYPLGIWRNTSPEFGATERGVLAFILIWLFHLLICTLSQAVAIAIPLADTATQIASLLYWFMIIFCG
jgi:ABC-type multidrug transport system permease subunit